MKELRRVRQDGDSGRADGCVVCAGNPIEVLIEPCGHVAVCKDCVRRMHRGAQCSGLDEMETECVQGDTSEGKLLVSSGFNWPPVEPFVPIGRRPMVV